MFGKRFWGLVPWMLEITAILTFLLGKYPDAIIIVALLLFNATLSLFQERRARSATVALKQRLRVQSRVKRDGKWSVIQAREIVPGDLVRVRIGDFVPADIKIVDGTLDVDQSALTGESGTVEKSGGDGELVYSGSAVKRGEATGIVYATGTRAYFGKSVELVELAKPKLHMEEITLKVARRLMIIVVASLTAAIVYALMTGFHLEVLVPLVAILLVASVPVAMPTMFTLNMALGSLTLAKKGVVVTRLSASEDAAAMDVLCTDKTGTITMNKLFVEDKSAVNGFSKSDVLLYGALASNEADQDPIDLAFLAAAAEAHLSLDTYSQTEFVPFDPQTRMTQAAIQKSGEKFSVRKGSVKAICFACQISDKDTAALRKSIEENFSSKGLRVIAVAKGDHQSGLQLVGLAGVADKIRESSQQTLSQIRDLGVSVKMLTGDSLPVAKNIAHQIGLGDKISTMPKTKDTSLGSAIEDSDGIAEIYPEDKYTIVKTLQNTGHIIGMTGDGINDAPALKQAEVGIAVVNATDIAKDSASAVLTAEGLGGIVAMIKTGRTIYQRILSWVLSMITWKIQVVGYIVIMLFLIHYLTFSILSMVLLLFLADFASMSISTDKVRYSLKPDSLNISWLFRIGLSLGIICMIEGVLFTMAVFSFFELNSSVNRLYTFTFAYLVLTGIFNLMMVRERNHFWKSRPSTLLIITMIGEILLVIAISLFGFLELAPLGYETFFGILGFVLLVSFLINDPVKVYLIRKFSNNTNHKKNSIKYG